MKTLIELYDVRPLENVLSTEVFSPERTVFICPVGPVGQYPIFVRLVNERRLSLKNCWFINMDEYLTDDGEWIDESSALSFHGFMNRTVYSRIDPELVMPENQRIFPGWLSQLSPPFCYRIIV